MKTKISFLFVVTFLFVLASKGQTEKSYDSLIVFQKNYKKNRFELNTPSIKTMSISQNKPRRASYPTGEILEDIGRVGLTLLVNAIWGEYTDTSIGDTDEVDWVLSSRFNCSYTSYNWDLQVFTKGLHYKEFYAAGPEIGSGGEREVWWDENTKGILLHQKDTISRFVILVKPDINAFIEKMAPDDFEERKINIMMDLKSTFGQGSLFLWNIDYALIGKFRGEDFAAISSEEAGKFWIFKNGIVHAILELPENLSLSETHKSEERHLLIAKENNSSLIDYLRLSMLYYYFRSNFE